MAEPLIKTQEFKVYNTSSQRLMFRGLIIPAHEMRPTVDSLLFRERDVARALELGIIQVVPDPRNFFAGDSGIPETGDIVTPPPSGGGDGTIIRTLKNFDTLTLTKGMPVYSPAPGQGKAAVGNSEGRSVYGIYAGNTDAAPGISGDVLVDGTLVATAIEWQSVTDMPGGLVRGRKYCLDLNVPGKLRLSVNSASPPSPSYLAVVGYALSATEFKLEIQPVIRLA